jgi:hypothetical protein
MALNRIVATWYFHVVEDVFGQEFKESKHTFVATHVKVPICGMIDDGVCSKKSMAFRAFSLNFVDRLE